MRCSPKKEEEDGTKKLDDLITSLLESRTCLAGKRSYNISHLLGAHKKCQKKQYPIWDDSRLDDMSEQELEDLTILVYSKAKNV